MEDSSEWGEEKREEGEEEEKDLEVWSRAEKVRHYTKGRLLLKQEQYV